MVGHPKGVDVNALLGTNYIFSPSCVMCRKTDLVTIGLFDTSLPSFEDWDLYIRIGLRFRIARVNAPLTVYHVHQQGRMMDEALPQLRAFEAIYVKHFAALSRNRSSRAKFFQMYSKKLIEAGRYSDARNSLWRSLVARPWDRETIRMMLSLLLSSDMYQVLSEVVRRLRRRPS